MTFNTIEQLILSVLIILTISSFSLDLFKKFKIIMKGTGNFPTDKIFFRLKKVFIEFILQKKVISQRFWPGLMHAFVFWGFIFFSIITIDHFLLGYNVHFFNYNFKIFYAKRVLRKYEGGGRFRRIISRDNFSVASKDIKV